MTINKIVREIEDRIRFLEEKEEACIQQKRQYDISDDDWWGLPQDHPRKRKINGYDTRLMDIRSEKRRLMDMLYEYNKVT